MKPLRELEFERKVSRAKDPTEIRLLCEAYQIQAGNQFRSEFGSMEPNLVPADFIPPKRQEPEHPAADNGLLRKIVKGPTGKAVLIEAFSPSGLDTLEQAVIRGQL